MCHFNIYLRSAPDDRRRPDDGRRSDRDTGRRAEDGRDDRREFL